MAITKWFDLSEYGVFVKVIEEQFEGTQQKSYMIAFGKDSKFLSNYEDGTIKKISQLVGAEYDEDLNLGIIADGTTWKKKDTFDALKENGFEKVKVNKIEANTLKLDIDAYEAEIDKIDNTTGIENTIEPFELKSEEPKKIPVKYNKEDTIRWNDGFEGIVKASPNPEQIGTHGTIAFEIALAKTRSRKTKISLKLVMKYHHMALVVSSPKFTKFYSSKENNEKDSKIIP